MKNLNTYIVGLLMAIFALIPPINFAVRPPSEYWHWWVLMAGFAGFFTLFIKTSWMIKFVAVGGFLNCFFSASPFHSFTSYILLIGCCYFYILCTSIKNWDPAFKLLQCLLIFNVLMFGLQYFGYDKLLNFGRAINYTGNFCFGVVGQHMQSASFSVILAAALMVYRPVNLLFTYVMSAICNSAGGFISATMGLTTWLYSTWNKRSTFSIVLISIIVFALWCYYTGKINANLHSEYGRWAVWKSSLNLALQKPIYGWGIGTYKGLFPALGGINSIPWKTAHNCWVQLAFEVGFIGLAGILFYSLDLLRRLIALTGRGIFRLKAYQCIAGLFMIGANMMIHFPTRMIQTILIIIFFIAYCEGVIKNGTR